MKLAPLTVFLLAACSGPETVAERPMPKPAAEIHPELAEHEAGRAATARDAPEAKASEQDRGDMAAAKTTPSKALETRVYMVAAMGDSLTDPASHGGKYLEFLRQRCPESRFDSYGVGGEMVNQMRRRFLRDIFGELESGEAMPKPKYDHVIVLGGLNDIISDESALRTNDKIKNDLAWMYAQAQARSAEVIAITLPPWAGFEKWYNPRRAASTDDMNEWIAEQRKRGAVNLLLDVYPLLSCGDAAYLCPAFGWPDQVHWSAKGHEIVGEALYEAFFSDCR